MFFGAVMRFSPLSQKNLLLGAGILALVAVIAALLVKRDLPVPSQTAVDDSAVQKNNLEDTGLQLQATAPQPTMATSVNSQSKAAAETLGAIVNKTPLSMWGVASIKDPEPSIKLNERVVEYQAVHLGSKESLIPSVGQEVTLPLLHGEILNVKVEAVENLSNGDVSWSGHFMIDGDSYPVVMTLGDNSSFATITTPKGSYSLESLNGSGWLYKNPAEIELSKPGTNDFLEVPNL